MSGKIEEVKYIILIISLITVVTDLAWGKIYNWFTVSAALVGVAVASSAGGWSGTAEACLGIFAGLLLYGWMFGLRFIGGGDVKFLMALGAWGGPRYTVEVALLGVLLGGAVSFLVLLFTGRMPGFIKRMYVFLLSIFIKELEVQLPKVDKTLTMPFGVPISIAAVWVAFAHPFQSLGVTLWW